MDLFPEEKPQPTRSVTPVDTAPTFDHSPVSLFPFADLCLQPSSSSASSGPSSVSG